MQHEPLTRQIIGAAMRVHWELGPGFLERDYTNALRLELETRGIDAELERRLQVRYRGAIVGEFVADMVVGGSVIIELKAVSSLVAGHEVQLVNYLAATGVELGLLLNFGAARLEFKRKSRVYRSGSDRSEPAETGGTERTAETG